MLRKSVCLFLSVAFLALVSPAFGQTVSIEDSLTDSIQSLEIINQELLTLNSKIEDLKKQTASLETLLQDSATQSAQLKAQHEELLRLLTAYQVKAETLKKNYGGLLSLSQRYATAYETSKTWVAVLGISTAALTLALILSLVLD